MVSWIYAGYTGDATDKVHRWSERISECAATLQYRWSLTPDGWRRKLVSARLCRVRTCPICAWRRSLKMQTELLHKVAALKTSRPELRPMMLTLTVRNCQLDELRTTVQAMLKGWSRMTRRVSMRGVAGWVRSVEITAGKRRKGEAHPHIHALLMVDAEMAADVMRISKAYWTAEWRDVMSLDYMPQVDICPVVGDSGISEVLKYAVKAAEYGSDTVWLPQVALALDRIRVYGCGGCIRVAEPDILDDADEHGTAVDAPPYIHGQSRPGASLWITYAWYRQQRMYRRVAVEIDTAPREIIAALQRRWAAG